MSSRNFGISKNYIAIFFKFQEWETPTNFMYTARNEVFSAIQGSELGEHFKQAAKLSYGHTKTEALKLVFQ
jgi:hypothetical protein